MSESQDISNREPVENLVVLLRGFFATPVLSSLGRLGVLQKMREMEYFHAESFPVIKNKKLLQDSLNYLLRLGLISIDTGNLQHYKVSKKGSEVFRRVNSFYVPHSYADYLTKYHEMIQVEDGSVTPEVERLENVIGSGITHLRYFPPAVSFLKRKTKFDILIDIGCGDGHFLSTVLKEVVGKKIVAIDMSEISTERTKANLLEEYPDLDLTTYCCDGANVQEWSKLVPKDIDASQIAISMWFLLQEISKSNPNVVIEFLIKVQKNFPKSPIIIGEMVRQSDEILQKNNHRSLIPEYLFFHEMSKQGVLPWEDYLNIIKKVGYEIVVEKLFDEVPDIQGRLIPSTFVWCLIPKENNDE